MMVSPKLGRSPSIRDRVEDTLSAHRNELVALLSRFCFLPFLFLFLSFLCLVAEKIEVVVYGLVS